MRSKATQKAPRLQALPRNGRDHVLHGGAVESQGWDLKVARHMCSPAPNVRSRPEGCSAAEPLFEGADSPSLSPLFRSRSREREVAFLAFRSLQRRAEVRENI